MTDSGHGVYSIIEISNTTLNGAFATVKLNGLQIYPNRLTLEINAGDYTRVHMTFDAVVDVKTDAAVTTEGNLKWQQ